MFNRKENDMKKIVGLILALSSFVFCTERVSMACTFEAIAVGYVKQETQHNYIYDYDKSRFYNVNGTYGNENYLVGFRVSEFENQFSFVIEKGLPQKN